MRTIHRGGWTPAYALFIVALLLVLSFFGIGDSAASVELVRFEATAHQDTGTIELVWETASEIDTLAFKLYRSTTGAAGTWGAAIHSIAATNSLTGDTYTYVDSSAQAGILYYYLLQDISTTGTVSSHGPVCAGINADCANPSPTPTGLPTATWTASVSGPQPTATRRYTNTPVVSPLSTPLPLGNSPAPGQRTSGSSFVATPTRIGPAVVTTPTRVGGVLPLATLPQVTPSATATVPLLPTLPPAVDTPTAVVLARITVAAGPSPTPLLRSDATPAVFEAVPTSGAPEKVAGTGGTPRSSFAIAGGILALAGVLGLVAYLVLRARR